MAEQLGDFVPFVGGPPHAAALLPPLQALATVEETVVRDRAAEALCKVCEQLPEAQVAEHFVPVIKVRHFCDWAPPNPLRLRLRARRSLARSLGLSPPLPVLSHAFSHAPNPNTNTTNNPNTNTTTPNQQLQKTAPRERRLVHRARLVVRPLPRRLRALAGLGLGRAAGAARALRAPGVGRDADGAARGGPEARRLCQGRRARGGRQGAAAALHGAHAGR